jgi:hypothetical protein
MILFGDCMAKAETFLQRAEAAEAANDTDRALMFSHMSAAYSALAAAKKQGR